MTKTGTGTLTVLGSLGSGLATLNANAGETKLLASQTLAALTIADAAIVTFGNGPAAFVGDLKGDLADNTAAVPEPGTAALLMVGALGLLRRGTRPMRRAQA